MKKIIGLFVIIMAIQNIAEAKPYKVLFIGNSLTFYHDQPGMFRDLAKASGIEVEVEQATFGGARLKDHNSNSITISKIKQEKWDFVVLQGSSYHIARPDLLHLILPYIEGLCKKIRENSKKTKIIFFMDWAMKKGVNWQGETYTYEKFQKLLYDGTYMVANKYGMIVAPIGWAWDTVIKENPRIDLFARDYQHPSKKGSYLGACVYFCTIFNKRANGLAFYGKLRKKKALYLQEVASNTVLKKNNSGL
jgi:hypothetical protein